MTATLSLVGVTRRFGALTAGGTAAVDRLSLDVQQGELLALVGASGSGKTTTLRIIAGHETPDEGRVLLDGRDITDLPPEQRTVNTVFQNYALFPHLTVRENIGFAPKMAGKGKVEIAAEVERMLALVDLTAHADKLPAKLSGGQKQRIGIARALAAGPRILLLDEPLAALDMKLRQRLLVELDAIIRVNVELVEAASSSLDLIVLADFTGEAAPHYSALQRLTQRVCMETAAANNWTVPYRQVVVHRAEDIELAADALPEVESK